MANTTTDKRTIEQLRAEHAFNCVYEAKNKQWESNYRSYVQALPATVLNNGLGQAAATELAAGKGQENNAHTKLFKHLESWLCGEHGPYHDGGAGKKKGLMRSIIDGDQQQYVRAQLEAIAWLEWLKKFASAYLTAEGQTNSEV